MEDKEVHQFSAPRWLSTVTEMISRATPPVAWPLVSRLAGGLRQVAVDAPTRAKVLRSHAVHALFPQGVSAAELYIDLLKKCLTRWIFLESGKPVDLEARSVGGDWPAEAETMIGMKRLDNLHYCVTDVIRRQVPGDLIETGVWRGGSTILMRGILKAYGDTDRTVWVADSFAGLPKPDPDLYPTDAEDALWRFQELAIPLAEVQANFARYDLLDSQVRFLPGLFRDTLPTAPIERLAVLRLDGDMYESTMDALKALYPKLSVGGFVIVDDYGAVRGCRAAVEDFRAAHGISEPLQHIDWTGVFWRRESPAVPAS